MKPYLFTQPPRMIQTANRDNFALVTTANFLAFKTRYQQIANDLPKGSILFVLPESINRITKSLQTVAAGLKNQGYRVTTISAKRFL